MMMIQLLPEGTSCTGTCEVLPRSHDGVGVTLHLLPPGDHIGSFQDDVDDDDDDVDVDDVDDDDVVATFLLLPPGDHVGDADADHDGQCDVIYLVMIQDDIL